MTGSPGVVRCSFGVSNACSATAAAVHGVPLHVSLKNTLPCVSRQGYINKLERQKVELFGG